MRPVPGASSPEKEEARVSCPRLRGDVGLQRPPAVQIKADRSKAFFQGEKHSTQRVEVELARQGLEQAHWLT